MLAPDMASKWNTPLRINSSRHESVQAAAVPQQGGFQKHPALVQPAVGTKALFDFRTDAVAPAADQPPERVTAACAVDQLNGLANATGMNGADKHRGLEGIGPEVADELAREDPGGHLDAVAAIEPAAVTHDFDLQVQGVAQPLAREFEFRGPHLQQGGFVLDLRVVQQ